VLAIGHGAAELPQVELEVRAVCAAHGQRARALLGEDASLHGLRAAAADARVLHLACHAHFRSDNPAFSALYLVDGPLALHELAQWRLTTDLAVLSACETGRGQLAAGDEVLGLTRTLRRAGVREVLASLWPVQDEATAELMAGLHRALAGGLPPAAALQQAQRAAIAGGRHPFHWAAFVLHGH
jgi:CHAT domain-containing protein